ncbi:hypothetical protein [Streptomyces sp. NPDC048196]|uniref:hypothetical protein n=1 Tax=Streptomyces sp. NPDC048196 TaxID=3154712 RepID=UPI0033F848BA
MYGKLSPGGFWSRVAVSVIALLTVALCVVRGLAAAGVTGTHGTFTVKECESHHSRTASYSGRSESGCTGSFRGDDSSLVDKAFLPTEIHYGAGTRLSAQSNQDSILLALLSSDYVLAGGSEAAGDFSGAFLALLIAAPALLYGFLTGGTRGTFREKREAWRAVKGTRTHTAVVSTAAVALFGVVVVGPVLGLVLTR